MQRHMGTNVTGRLVRTLEHQEPVTDHVTLVTLHTLQVCPYQAVSNKNIE